MIRHDDLSQDIVESIYAINDWGYSVICIAGRLYAIDGDLQMADQFQSNDEHFFYGKDVTQYLIGKVKLNITSPQMRQEFTFHLDNNLKRRNLRFHKAELYVRYSV